MRKPWHVSSVLVTAALSYADTGVSDAPSAVCCSTDYHTVRFNEVRPKQYTGVQCVVLWRISVVSGLGCRSICMEWTWT
jgi:hypothetical protein